MNLNRIRYLVLSAALVLLAGASPSASAMTQLGDNELASVVGRGGITLYQDVARTLDPAHSDELAEKIVFFRKQLFSQILDYDETVEGRLDRSVTTVEMVGDEVHLLITVDDYIARITLANIRPKGSDPAGPYFGTMTFNNVSIQGTIDVRYHP
jgi:hypothetical protein